MSFSLYCHVFSLIFWANVWKVTSLKDRSLAVFSKCLCLFVGHVMFSMSQRSKCLGSACVLKSKGVWVNQSVSRWQSQILSCRQTVSGQLKSSSHQYFHQPEGSLDGPLWRGLDERALERLDSSHGWVQQEVHPSSRNYQKDRSCSFWKDFKRFLTPSLSYMVRKYATK